MMRSLICLGIVPDNGGHRNIFRDWEDKLVIAQFFFSTFSQVRCIDVMAVTKLLGEKSYLKFVQNFSYENHSHLLETNAFWAIAMEK